MNERKLYNLNHEQSIILSADFDFSLHAFELQAY